MIPLPSFVLLPQLLVAVVLSLGSVGEYRPTTHVARLAPVLTVVRMGLEVPAEELYPAALVGAGD